MMLTKKINFAQNSDGCRRQLFRSCQNASVQFSEKRLRKRSYLPKYKTNKPKCFCILQLIRIFESDPGFSPLHCFFQCNILSFHSIVREFPKDTVFTFVEEIKRFRFLCSYVRLFKSDLSFCFPAALFKFKLHDVTYI